MAWYWVMVELFTGIWLLDVENPKENPPEDLVELAASCVSLCHLLTTSFAIGSRWYEEIKAAEETEGFLSTIAVFITRSILCTVDAYTCQFHLPPRHIEKLTSMMRHKALIAFGL